MDYTDYLNLLSVSARKVRDVTMEFVRPIAEQIDWENRLIAIKGARGTGKTTLMLQHIKKSFGAGEQALYVSLDNLWFAAHPIQEVAEMHVMNGGTHLFLDEVHYHENWQTLIKNLYDDYPSLNIIYSGSSILKIETSRGDLSRRQIEYLMPGLSFREFLIFEGVLRENAVSLEVLLSDHIDLAEKIAKETNIIPLFNRYLRQGYYPFYRDVHSGYETRIQQIVNQILENDLPSVEPVSIATVRKIKKMLMILAESTPHQPNMSKLFEQLETDRNQGMKMLSLLSRANLLALLSSESGSLKNMSRPEKIYCDNTNLMAALSDQFDTGCARETFFLNQLRSAGYRVTYPPAGDFLINGKFLFEVGGKGKTFSQIRNIPDSFLAVDDTEVGLKNRIPLWMFGFLY